MRERGEIGSQLSILGVFQNSGGKWELGKTGDEKRGKLGRNSWV